MEANRILLEKKYARIIISIAEKKKISIEEAMRIFYESEVSQLLNKGEADLHCRSDFYIRDEILLEVMEKEEMRKGFSSRMAAYQKALERLRE